MELLASQDESQEEDDGHQAPAEDEEEPATVELVLEGEHEEDEEVSATEAGGVEGSNESVGADGDEELPVSQASQEDDDDDPAKVEDEAASACHRGRRLGEGQPEERAVLRIRPRQGQRRLA